jgi:hypothetical protein
VSRTNPLVNDRYRLPDCKEVIGWAWAIEEKRGCALSSSSICHIHKTNPLNPNSDEDENDDYYEYTNFPSNPKIILIKTMTDYQTGLNLVLIQ